MLLPSSTKYAFVENALIRVLRANGSNPSACFFRPHEEGGCFSENETEDPLKTRRDRMSIDGSGSSYLSSSSAPFYGDPSSFWERYLRVSPSDEKVEDNREGKGETHREHGGIHSYADSTSGCCNSERTDGGTYALCEVMYDPILFFSGTPLMLRLVVVPPLSSLLPHAQSGTLRYAGHGKGINETAKQMEKSDNMASMTTGEGSEALLAPVTNPGSCRTPSSLPAALSSYSSMPSCSFPFPLEEGSFMQKCTGWTATHFPLRCRVAMSIYVSSAIPLWASSFMPCKNSFSWPNGETPTRRTVEEVKQDPANQWDRVQDVCQAPIVPPRTSSVLRCPSSGGGQQDAYRGNPPPATTILHGEERPCRGEGCPPTLESTFQEVVLQDWEMRLHTCSFPSTRTRNEFIEKGNLGEGEERSLSTELPAHFLHRDTIDVEVSACAVLELPVHTLFHMTAILQASSSYASRHCHPPSSLSSFRGSSGAAEQDADGNKEEDLRLFLSLRFTGGGKVYDDEEHQAKRNETKSKVGETEEEEPKTCDAVSPPRHSLCSILCTKIKEGKKAMHATETSSTCHSKPPLSSCSPLSASAGPASPATSQRSKSVPSHRLQQVRLEFCFPDTNEGRLLHAKWKQHQKQRSSQPWPMGVVESKQGEDKHRTDKATFLSNSASEDEEREETSLGLTTTTGTPGERSHSSKWCIEGREERSSNFLRHREYSPFIPSSSLPRRFGTVQEEIETHRMVKEEREGERHAIAAWHHRMESKERNVEALWNTKSKQTSEVGTTQHLIKGTRASSLAPSSSPSRPPPPPPPSFGSLSSSKMFSKPTTVARPPKKQAIVHIATEQAAASLSRSPPSLALPSSIHVPPTKGTTASPATPPIDPHIEATARSKKHSTPKGPTSSTCTPFSSSAGASFYPILGSLLRQGSSFGEGCHHKRKHRTSLAPLPVSVKGSFPPERDQEVEQVILMEEDEEEKTEEDPNEMVTTIIMVVDEEDREQKKPCSASPPNDTCHGKEGESKDERNATNAGSPLFHPPLPSRPPPPPPSSPPRTKCRPAATPQYRRTRQPTSHKQEGGRSNRKESVPLEKGAALLVERPPHKGTQEASMAKAVPLASSSSPEQTLHPGGKHSNGAEPVLVTSLPSPMWNLSVPSHSSVATREKGHSWKGLSTMTTRIVTTKEEEPNKSGTQDKSFRTASCSFSLPRSGMTLEEDKQREESAGEELAKVSCFPRSSLREALGSASPSAHGRQWKKRLTKQKDPGEEQEEDEEEKQLSGEETERIKKSMATRTVKVDRGRTPFMTEDQRAQWRASSFPTVSFSSATVLREALERRKQEKNVIQMAVINGDSFGVPSKEANKSAMMRATAEEVKQEEEKKETLHHSVRKEGESSVPMRDDADLLQQDSCASCMTPREWLDSKEVRPRCVSSPPPPPFTTSSRLSWKVVSTAAPGVQRPILSAPATASAFHRSLTRDMKGIPQATPSTTWMWSTRTNCAPTSVRHAMASPSSWKSSSLVTGVPQEKREENIGGSRSPHQGSPLLFTSAVAAHYHKEEEGSAKDLLFSSPTRRTFLYQRDWGEMRGGAYEEKNTWEEKNMKLRDEGHHSGRTYEEKNTNRREKHKERGEWGGRRHELQWEKRGFTRSTSRIRPWRHASLSLFTTIHYSSPTSSSSRTSPPVGTSARDGTSTTAATVRVPPQTLGASLFTGAAGSRSTTTPSIPVRWPYSLLEDRRAIRPSSSSPPLRSCSTSVAVASKSVGALRQGSNEWRTLRQQLEERHTHHHQQRQQWTPLVLPSKKSSSSPEDQPLSQDDAPSSPQRFLYSSTVDVGIGKEEDHLVEKKKVDVAPSRCKRHLSSFRWDASFISRKGRCGGNASLYPCHASHVDDAHRSGRDTSSSSLDTLKQATCIVHEKEVKPCEKRHRVRREKERRRGEEKGEVWPPQYFPTPPEMIVSLEGRRGRERGRSMEQKEKTAAHVRHERRWLKPARGKAREEEWSTSSSSSPELKKRKPHRRHRSHDRESKSPVASSTTSRSSSSSLLSSSSTTVQDVATTPLREMKHTHVEEMFVEWMKKRRRDNLLRTRASASSYSISRRKEREASRKKEAEREEVEEEEGRRHEKILCAIFRKHYSADPTRCVKLLLVVRCIKWEDEKRANEEDVEPVGEKVRDDKRKATLSSPPNQRDPSLSASSCTLSSFFSGSPTTTFPSAAVSFVSFSLFKLSDGRRRSKHSVREEVGGKGDGSRPSRREAPPGPEEKTKRSHSDGIHSCAVGPSPHSHCPVKEEREDVELSEMGVMEHFLWHTQFQSDERSVATPSLPSSLAPDQRRKEEWRSVSIPIPSMSSSTLAAKHHDNEREGMRYTKAVEREVKKDVGWEQLQDVLPAILQDRISPYRSILLPLVGSAGPSWTAWHTSPRFSRRRRDIFFSHSTDDKADSEDKYSHRGDTEAGQEGVQKRHTSNPSHPTRSAAAPSRDPSSCSQNEEHWSDRTQDARSESCTPLTCPSTASVTGRSTERAFHAPGAAMVYSRKQHVPAVGSCITFVSTVGSTSSSSHSFSSSGTPEGSAVTLPPPSSFSFSHSRDDAFSSFSSPPTPRSTSATGSWLIPGLQCLFGKAALHYCRGHHDAPHATHTPERTIEKTIPTSHTSREGEGADDDSSSAMMRPALHAALVTNESNCVVILFRGQVVLAGELTLADAAERLWRLLQG